MRAELFLPLLLSLGGCLFYERSHSKGGGGADAEGSFAGECHNGEDDDSDGVVDCRDDDCAAAANCADHEVIEEEDSGTTNAARSNDAKNPSNEEDEPVGAVASLGAGALLALLAVRAGRGGAASG